MLTLFVLATSEGNRSVTKTVNSVDPHQFLVVGSVDDININYDFKTSWFLVLYDNEYLSFDLRKAVKTIMLMGDVPYDALILLEKGSDGKLYQSPRLFKKHVRLAKDSLLPEDRSTKMERILDGWVNKHAI